MSPTALLRYVSKQLDLTMRNLGVESGAVVWKSKSFRHKTVK